MRLIAICKISDAQQRLRARHRPNSQHIPLRSIARLVGWILSCRRLGGAPGAGSASRLQSRSGSPTAIPVANSSQR